MLSIRAGLLRFGLLGRGTAVGRPTVRFCAEDPFVDVILDGGGVALYLHPGLFEALYHFFALQRLLAGNLVYAFTHKIPYPLPTMPSNSAACAWCEGIPQNSEPGNAILAHLRPLERTALQRCIVESSSGSQSSSSSSYSVA